MTSQYPQQTSTGPGFFGLAIGALVAALTIIAIISLVHALNRGPIERKTSIGPSTTQLA